MKIGFRAAADKRNDCKDCRGFRNSFDITPTLNGKPIGPESGQGEALIEKYGELQGFISIDGVRSGFEHQGCSLEDRHAGRPCGPIGDEYIFVDATNSDKDLSHWFGKTYLAAGPRLYCVTWPHLDHYRCQDCTMDERGAVVGCGTNDRGYDLKK